MAENKTQPTDASVPAFLDSVAPPVRQQQAREMEAPFHEVSGCEPVLWAPTKAQMAASLQMAANIMPG